VLNVGVLLNAAFLWVRLLSAGVFSALAIGRGGSDEACSRKSKGARLKYFRKKEFEPGPFSPLAAFKRWGLVKAGFSKQARALFRW
jgi:hypothetical protein